jgi:transcriptional regulator with XRE-family HTH domain
MHHLRLKGTVDDDLTMNVELVQKLLRELHWSWADLARAMRMSKSTIIRVKSYTTRPGRKFIFRLENVFPEHRAELFIPAPPELPAEKAA